jgi:hypothetical protein
MLALAAFTVTVFALDDFAVDFAGAGEATGKAPFSADFVVVLLVEELLADFADGFFAVAEVTFLAHMSVASHAEILSVDTRFRHGHHHTAAATLRKPIRNSRQRVKL